MDVFASGFSVCCSAVCLNSSARLSIARVFLIPDRGLLGPRGLYRGYHADMLLEAIEGVHWGKPVPHVSAEHGVPKSTIRSRLQSCKKGHPGRCEGAYLKHPEFAVQPERSHPLDSSGFQSAEGKCVYSAGLNWQTLD
ncbi:hypothetical protein BaRGS_00035378 [Batillaria attramentaria]|uniref:HTH psq-type domain-containing protein n=1 Tax=Batillaria attramentaria TaxID=370345 RepID=A0ABD0JEK3_9CAEN